VLAPQAADYRILPAAYWLAVSHGFRAVYSPFFTPFSTVKTVFTVSDEKTFPHDKTFPLGIFRHVRPPSQPDCNDKTPLRSSTESCSFRAYCLRPAARGLLCCPPEFTRRGGRPLRLDCRAAPRLCHGTVAEQCQRRKPMFSSLRAQTSFHRFEIFFRAPRAIPFNSLTLRPPLSTTNLQGGSTTRVAIPLAKRLFFQAFPSRIATRSGDTFTAKNIFHFMLGHIMEWF